MGLSSGLTLQMDLIVLRNSIFCHSACTLCPSLGPPDCSERGPYQQHSGCGIEELSSASNQTTRKSDSERTGGRGRGRKRKGIKSLDASTLPLRHKPHTHITLAPVCNTCIHYNNTWTHMSAHTRCVKFASQPIDGAPSGEAFIRSNFQCYLPVLGASAQIELFLSTR